MRQEKQNAGSAWAAWDQYWDLYAHAFANPIQTNGLLSEFVTNPAVTGAYAEAWVRATVTNMLARHFRISTGAVICPTDGHRGLAQVPQCDLIVWDPSEMPAIFEFGQFALVPMFAVRAIIEVERTFNKKRLGQQLKDRLKRTPIPRLDRVLGVVISHRHAQFEEDCNPNWLTERSALNPPITRILDGDNKPDTKGIMAFIYFLAQVAGHDQQHNL